MPFIFQFYITQLTKEIFLMKVGEKLDLTVSNVGDELIQFANDAKRSRTAQL